MRDGRPGRRPSASTVVSKTIRCAPSRRPRALKTRSSTVTERESPASSRFPSSANVIDTTQSSSTSTHTMPRSGALPLSPTGSSNVRSCSTARVHSAALAVVAGTSSTASVRSMTLYI